MWWVALLAGTALLWLASDDRQSRYLLALMGAGILAMQVGKLLPLGDSMWVYAAFVWLVVAGKSVGDATSRQAVTFTTLMLVSVMCYASGGLGGMMFAPMSPAIVIDEVSAWLAIFVVGGPCLVGRVLGYFARIRAYWAGRRSGASPNPDPVHWASARSFDLAAMEAVRFGL